MGITANEYLTLEDAYNFFNGCLFHDQLPQCLITYQRGKKFKGYFSPNRYVKVGDKSEVPEIALNPEHFSAGDLDVLSTLVHEMCHVWQHFHGKQPRAGYHDRQWANKMIEVGLLPFNIKDPTKKTGAACSHVIDFDGVFVNCCNLFLEGGKKLQHMARIDAPKEKKKKNASKTKYTCPECETAVWGKPDLHLICGYCWENLDESIVRLIQAPTDDQPED